MSPRQTRSLPSARAEPNGPASTRHRLRIADRLQTVGRGVEVFKNGEPHVEDGRVEDDARELIGVKQRLDVRSQVDVALDVNGARHGMLSAQSAQPDFFGEQDLRFLQAVVLCA